MDIQDLKERVEKLEIQEILLRHECERILGKAEYLDWDECYKKLSECVQGNIKEE